jgi:prolyl-tRNA editing enzyme YbaK/EbsC (Cys-tRNA(Pro) deacylase)
VTEDVRVSTDHAAVDEGPVHRNVERVVAALTAGGADPARVARLRVLPEAVTTAAAAAAALGVGVGQIANSLVFDADGTPLLVLTSGAHRVDTRKIAVLVGALRVRRASPEFVREATGQVIGGVAPVGHPVPIKTLVDRALEQYDEVWAAGGVARAVFPSTCAELVKVTGGEPADVA